MHVDRRPRAATIGDEAEDGTAGLAGFEDETVSEARDSASVNMGKRKWKRQEKKQSGCFCNTYYVVLLYLFSQVAHAKKATTH